MVGGFAMMTTLKDSPIITEPAVEHMPPSNLRLSPHQCHGTLKYLEEPVVEQTYV